MTRMYRKVIRITAGDSPNVITGQRLFPGVITRAEHDIRRKTWDKVRQCIGLDAQFYEGAEVMLFPSIHLNRAHLCCIPRERARIGLEPFPFRRLGKGLGVDPAEGGDSSSFAVVDEYGLLFLESIKTPDTAVIPDFTIHLMERFRIPADRVCFDRGGGGKQHADALRRKGYAVYTVAFGESVALPIKKQAHRTVERVETKELGYTYKNRRAQMFHALSLRLSPDDMRGFTLPEEYINLRSELAPLPKLYDGEGRIWLPSKGTVTEEMKHRNIKTLIDIIGHSPDEADALAIAEYIRVNKPKRISIGGE